MAYCHACGGDGFLTEPGPCRVCNGTGRVGPTPKSPAVEGLLEGLAGRTTAIEGDRCVRPPFGCGGPATDFRDERSRHEYRISGLCQQCQDTVFGEGE
jgi:hypothetical protein